MIIKKVASGYEVCVTLSEPVRLIRIHVSIGSEIEIPEIYKIVTQGDKTKLVNAIEMAYKLLVGEVKFE